MFSSNGVSIRRVARALAALLLAVGCAGCGNWWWTSFLDPTQVSGDFRRQEIVEIQRSLTFEDTPPGIPGAEDPTPEDTVAILEEHRLEPDDLVQIRIPRFVEYEMYTDLAVVVNEVGEIQVPQLGWIHVEGMTARELEQHLQDLMVQQGIFREGNVPPITIIFPRQTQRYFNIFGGVLNPDTYRILEPNFRLLDALSLAGGLPEQVEWIYVYRAQPRPIRVRRTESNLGAQSAVPPAIPPQPPSPPVAPEAPPVTPSELSGTPAGAGALAQAGPAPLPATAPDRERELIEAITPGPPRPAAPAGAATGPAESAPAPGEAAPPPAGPRFIYLNGQWVDVTRQEKPSPPQTQPQTAPRPEAAPATGPTTEPVTWETVAQGERQRIIRIPAEGLRRGDARYNIVVRNRDVIRVDPGPVGEFYLLGQVNRPGAYTLTGREVTLKQAIAAAGGLAVLAWPSRCEITRRLDQDREQIIPVNLEQIFAGNQPDVYLRPNDIVNVGTNVVAPFLATIRTSFRMSYGFGFVYDRNFGDIDAYGPKINPEIRRQQELQQRFPGLFP